MKSAIVTGGAGAIGQACVRRLARDGYAVIINYKSSKSAAEALEKELAEAGYTAHAVCADISQGAEAKRLVAICESLYGGVDVLVNNAGVSYIGTIEQTDETEWCRIMDNNIKSCYNMCRAVAPLMRENGGRVINISSMWGVYGGSAESAYSSSKAAMIGLTKALAKEFSLSPGVNVNCIAPGYIETKMNSHLTDEEKAELVSDIPISRAGTPEDVSGAVSFFASADSSYITGQVLVIDGGFCL